MTATVDRLLTVEQVAERLGASGWTVRRWLREGKLKGRKIGGDRLGYRVKESDLEAFINGVPAAER